MRDRLAAAPRRAFVVFVGLSAMMTYFCMYVFRKPFAAGTYEDMPFGHVLDFKTALIISQVIGYALSKFIGIKVVSELTAANRTRVLLLCILVSELALVLFAILPAPLNIAALFLNGLPLGLIWGVVFSYLEGRRVTEALGVILSVSLIFASGAAKSIGRYLLVHLQIAELWMPAVAGALIFPLLALSAWCLQLTPSPDEQDKQARQERVPMDGQQRLTFFREYATGIVCLVLCYVILTAFRDFTDNFAAEMWIALGFGESPAVFTLSTLPVVAAVLVALCLLMFVRSNRRALFLNQVAVLAGFAVLAVATAAFELHLIGGVAWMVLLQLGLYLAYIPFNSLLFERLVATAPRYANAGFLIYVADAFGYLGSIGVLLYKSVAQPQLPWIDFVISAAYGAAAVGVVLSVGAMAYFTRRFAGQSLQLKWAG